MLVEVIVRELTNIPIIRDEEETVFHFAGSVRERSGLTTELRLMYGDIF